jgi:hypothetical protein
VPRLLGQPARRALTLSQERVRDEALLAELAKRQRWPAGESMAGGQRQDARLVRQHFDLELVSRVELIREQSRERDIDRTRQELVDLFEAQVTDVHLDVGVSPGVRPEDSRELRVGR